MQVLRRITEPAAVCASAVLGSLAFLLAGPYSNFAPVGFLDPWYYTGYFLHFSYLVRTYGPTYYVSRLPWILPGLAVFQLATPEIASVALNVLIVAASAGALYWSIRWFYGPAAGATAAALLVTNPYFMCTVCWDYPNGPAIAYAFIALAFAVRPNGTRLFNCIMLGVFLALAGLTHLAAASLVIAIAAIPLWRQRRSVRELLREAVFIGAGAAAAILALCPVSQLLFGRWTYFYWQIYTTTHQVDPGELARTVGSGLDFLRSSQRLFAPALLLLLGPLLLRRPHKQGSLLMFGWLSLFVCLILLAFSEFAVGIVSLRLQYYSCYLMVPVFFFAGAMVGESASSWTRGLPVIIVAFALPFSFALWAWPQHPWRILFTCGAVTTALLAIRQFRIASVILAAVLFLSPALDPSCGYAWDLPKPPDGRNLDAFRTLMTFDSTIHSATNPARRLRFWFDRDEPVVNFFDSAESLYVWIPADFTRELPSWPEAELRRQVPPNTTFVNLTLHPERIPERVRLLSARGVHVANERRFQLPYHGKTVYIVLQDVEPAHAG